MDRLGIFILPIEPNRIKPYRKKNTS